MSKLSGNDMLRRPAALALDSNPIVQTSDSAAPNVVQRGDNSSVDVSGPLADAPRATDLLRELESVIDGFHAEGEGDSATYMRLQDAARDASHTYNAAKAAAPKTPDSELERLEAKKDRAHAALKRFQAGHSAAIRRRNELAESHTAARRFLNNARRTGEKFADAPEIDSKGWTLEEVRQQRGELVAKREAINAAPIPLEFARNNLLREIADLQRRGEPTVRIEKHFTNNLRKRRDQYTLRAVTVWPLDSLDGEEVSMDRVKAFIVAQGGEALRNKMIADLEKAYAEFEGQTYTDQEKRKALAAIDLEILDVERLESALVWETHEATERPLDFDADMSPLAVLQIETAAA